MTSNTKIPAAQIERMRGMWDNGVSPREIARLCFTTRNAVIGIAHRNGFAKRPNPVAALTPEREAEIVAYADSMPSRGHRRIAKALNAGAITVLTVLQKHRPGRMPTRATMIAVTTKRPARGGPAAVPEAGSITQTENASPKEPKPLPVAVPVRPDRAPLPACFRPTRPGCSWPIGEPGTSGFRYCDEPRMRRSYCAEHAAIAFRGPSPSEASLTRGRSGGRA